MRGSPALDLSVILPFRDDEEAIGGLVRRIATHLTAQDLRFEILAVDEGSNDNSLALLALLRDQLRELCLLAARAGAGFAAGSRVARGKLLLLFDVAAAGAPLGPLAWARQRVESEHAELVVVPGRFSVCRRTRAWQVLEKTRGRGAEFERRLIRRARARGLLVEAPAQKAVVGLASLNRFLLRFRRA